MPNLEECEDQNTLKIELTEEAPPWDPSSSGFKYQEQSMFNYRGQFVSTKTPAKQQSLTNFVMFHAHDAADVMDDNN